jgi:hypothetical protein
MKRPSTKTLFLVTIGVLALSVVLGVISLFPTYPGGSQSNVLINNTFTLSPNETYRQGLGSFRGGENISLLVQSPTIFQKNFSIVFPNSTYLLINTGSSYSNSTDSNIAYSFNATGNYYEALFTSHSSTAGIVHFQVSVQEQKVIFADSWLNQASKMMFIVSLCIVVLLTLKIVFSNSNNVKLNKLNTQGLSKKSRQRLIVLLSLSLIIWLGVLVVSTNPLGTFENWYTDNARHTYVSSLFLKDGFSVFNQPLGTLANTDTSSNKFVTWPEMPHLYPLGSILLFLPFGILVQNGFDATLIYKAEIAIFLIIATICIYFFFKDYFKKDMALILKLIGVYIIYVTLMVYSADGMFDSVAFLFTLFAISMFMAERYDYFFLLVTISTFFKYQAGIFLFPLIIVSLIKLYQTNKPIKLLKNKAVISGVIFGSVSLFTAYLSAPYFMATGPQLILNGINAFSSNSHISWSSQSASVLLTLVVVIAYSIYMLNKNSLLSLSAIFLLFPSFMLPYFQNWYISFIFVYILIPQRKKELEVTILLLFFMIMVLSFAGANYYPFIGYL